MSEVSAFNVEAATRLLIERVDRLERVLTGVRAAMPVPSFREPEGESMAGPSDHERLVRIGIALAELGSTTPTTYLTRGELDQKRMT